MQFAKLKWDKQQPYSLDFDDVYYSSANGLAETEYVFIQHNQLDERFTNLQTIEFIIIETGFGTGLNYFSAIQHFINHAPANTTLRFISIERYPLHPEDFMKANQHWPMFSDLVSALQTAYEQLKDGLNQLSLCDGRIQLDLWIGDVSECLPKIQTAADAWFLDGFAPSKNSDMWSAQLFDQIKRLSKSNTTFATFTSAGKVRRQLQRIGFQVNKTKGFGKKREMLFGVHD
ncbi:MAG: tRNA (5-methylaminomethyl-2-thiouridine)(34)-methyltransferase MnmD [Methylophilaceae bacterium]